MNEDKPLIDIRPQDPKPNEVWRHYKGNYYLIVGIFTHTETGEKFVGYIGKERNFWSRPLDMWSDWVMLEESKFPGVILRVSRFTRTLENIYGPAQKTTDEEMKEILALREKIDEHRRY